MVALRLRSPAFIAALLVLLAGVAGWLAWRWQPERQAPARFERLLARAAAQRWTAAGWLVADDYADRWGFDKRSLLLHGRAAFRPFRWVELRARDVSWSFGDRVAVVTARITVQGEGDAFAERVRDVANASAGPATFTFRRCGWAPWDWELASIDHPELELGRWRFGG